MKRRRKEVEKKTKTLPHAKLTKHRPLFFLLYFKIQEKATAVHSQSTLEAQLQIEQPNFWVISDNHFFAKTLFEESAVFKEFEAGAVGKDLRYSQDLLAALVEKALIEQPTGLILTGDLTLNGEKESLDQMTQTLAPLKKAGIFVFAIPGNHDIHNGWARKFTQDQQLVAHQISPSDFKTAFSDGYEFSVSQDAHSLSYAVDLATYRLVFVDSNLYSETFSKEAPITQGRVKEKTLTWLEQVLSQARETNKIPLLFLHHNVLAHNEKVQQAFVLNNASNVLDLVATYQVPVAFSGHIHLQDITKSPTLPKFYEITTSAFSIAESHIGHVTLQPDQLNYEVENFDPRPYFTAAQRKKPDLNDYPNYLVQRYEAVGASMAENTLYRIGIKDEALIQSAKEMVGSANLRYFTGHNSLTTEEQAAIQTDPVYQFLQENSTRLARQVEQSLNDPNTPNNQSLTLELP